MALVAYLVVDADDGVMYETLAPSAIGAVKNIPRPRNNQDVLLDARMLSGKMKVHRVNIELLDAVNPETETKI